MKKRNLLIFILPVIFLFGIIFSFFYYQQRKSPLTDSTPVPETENKDLSLSPFPSPLVQDPVKAEAISLIADLEKIKTDILNARVEDKRLLPPDFFIEKEVLE